MLDRISVKSPCTQPWDEMEGDDRSRLCFRCTKTVYDLGAMDSEEAEAFIERHLRSDEGVCVRFYRRPDGRVLTSECGPGNRARHLQRAAKVLAGSVAGVTLSGMVGVSLMTLNPDLPIDVPTTAELLTRDLPMKGQDMRKNDFAADFAMGELAESPSPGPAWDPDRPSSYAGDDEPETERGGTATRTERKRTRERAQQEREEGAVVPITVRLVSPRF